MKICIDPGHGGSDPGACANGLKEKELNLYISKRVADALLVDYQDAAVLLTRVDDKTLSLDQRVKKSDAYKADFFVSIHNNAGGGTGFESYVLPGAYAATVAKQTAIHDTIAAFLKSHDRRDRGKKTANFYVIKNTNASAVLLECLFVDHAHDAALLKQTSFLNGLADAIAVGIAKALGLKGKPKPAPTPAPTSAPPSGKLYKVQVGAYKNKSNAEECKNKAIKAGFKDAFIV